MRVLHAVHAYPPSVGGSEQVVARLSRGLLDRGHEVEVATASDPDRGEEVDGIPVTGFRDAWGGWRAYRRWVHRGLDEDRWDVVMTYHSKVWTHLALAPFGKVSDRWVYAPTEFTDLSSKALRHFVYYRTLEPLSLKRARRVMVLTRADAEQAQALAGEDIRERVRVIPNGVDVGYWSSGSAGDVRARFALPEDAPLALYVGGFWPHKEVHTLIDALTVANEVHLALAGPERELGQSLRRRAKRRGVAQRVHFLGPVERDDLRALYHAADVHASASNNEGFGLTFLEAMAAGTPVVARAVGVVPELVDQDAAVEVAESPAGFAEALEHMIGRSGDQNRRLAKTYDWEAVIDQVADLYREVAG